MSLKKTTKKKTRGLEVAHHQSLEGEMLFYLTPFSFFFFFFLE